MRGAGDIYLIYGVVGIAISYVAWATSVQINKPAVAVALSFSAQAFVALGDRLLFRTRLSRLQMTAVAVNLLACGVVADLRNPAEVVHSPLGLLVGLANGLAFASYTLVGRAMARTGRRDPLTTLFYTFGFGALALILWGSVVDGPAALRVSQNALGWLLLVALAVGPTLGAYALYNASLRSLPATVASIVTTLEPLLVALLAIVLLRRTLQPSQWIGMVLMVGSFMWYAVQSSRPACQDDRYTRVPSDLVPLVAAETLRTSAGPAVATTPSTRAVCQGSPILGSVLLPNLLGYLWHLRDLWSLGDRRPHLRSPHRGRLRPPCNGRRLYRQSRHLADELAVLHRQDRGSTKASQTKAQLSGIQVDPLLPYWIPDLTGTEYHQGGSALRDL